MHMKRYEVYSHMKEDNKLCRKSQGVRAPWDTMKHGNGLKNWRTRGMFQKSTRKVQEK